MLDLAHDDGFWPAGLTRDDAELPQRRAEHRTPPKYYLEAIVIGGIVAASYLNAALHILH